MIYSREAVIAVIDLLNGIGAPYLVTGALATNVYSEPRSTVDGDFVVDMDSAQLHRLFESLQQDFEIEPQMAFETATGKTLHKFRHRRTEFVVEFFEANMSDPHEASRFARRVQGHVEGRLTFIPTAEDILIQKLRWISRLKRSKDIQDVVMLLRYRANRLDWAYIFEWCERHGTRGTLDELKAEADANPINGA